MKTSRTLHLLVLGQSNAANSVSADYASPTISDGTVQELFRGKCYAAVEYSLGATGTGKSIWREVGERLVESGRFDSVTFLVVAADGAEIKRFGEGSDLWQRATVAIKSARTVGFQPDFVLWSQGEADAWRQTPPKIYKERLLRAIHALRLASVEAPSIVAVSSRCDTSHAWRNPSPIAEAQKAVVSRESNPAILPGPNSDEMITSRMRYDGCHFNQLGAGVAAKAWASSILIRPTASQRHHGAATGQ